MTLPAIVSPHLLAELIATPRDLVLLDARPGEATFREGHLRGAIHAGPNSDLSRAGDPDFDPRHGGRHPLPPVDRWTRLLGQWGIGPSTPVVVYDDNDGSNAAARAWWMLRSVGHADAGVLDGGFRAAVENGMAITTEITKPSPREPYPAEAWQLPTVDMETIDRLRADPDWKVLDVRSEPRFRGQTEPIDPIAGHIPGAVNLPFTDNLDGNSFKPADALREQYERLLDGTSPDHLIVHCGSGVTACHTLLALEAAGLTGASLYVGSWSEWCRNDMPRATNLTLFEAVQRGKHDEIRDILRQFPESATLRDADGATALHYAAEMGDREAVAMLLDAGADINARDSRFHATPAGWAIEYLRQREALLGIEIEDCRRAITTGDVPLLQHYVSRLPALRDAVDRDGTPLKVHAANTGNPEIIRLFGS